MSNQAEIFNEVAKDYRTIHTENIKISGETSDYFADYKIKELTRILTPDKPLKVLDLGCGDGISATFFKKHFSKLDYFGLDISDESIKIAKKRNLDNCSFSLFDGLSIDFSHSTFDCIFIACVLHHINHDEHAKLLLECKKVLKPGGLLIIFEHNPINPITLKIVKDCVFDKDAVLVKHKNLVKELNIAGFIKTKTIFTLFFPRHKIFKPLIYLEKFLGFLPFGAQYYTSSYKSEL